MESFQLPERLRRHRRLAGRARKPIAAAVIEYGKSDGSLEQQRYIDTDYKPSNPPLAVSVSQAPR